MPWRPTFDESVDSRLDPFQERAGRPTDHEDRQGWVFVRPWVIADRTGVTCGEQRWGPQYEVSAGYVLIDAETVPVHWGDRRADVAAEVRDWESGSFVWLGRRFQVSWVGAEESRRIRDEVFQLGAPEH